MQQTRQSRRDGVIAWSCVALVHALLIWTWPALLRSQSPPRADQPMELVWVAAPPLPRPAPPAAVGVARSPARSAVRAKTAAPIATAPETDPVSSTTDARPLTAIFIAQAQQLAEQQAPLQLTPADPFPRNAPLRPQSASRLHVRMREPMSPDRALRMIGGLFGGPGPDPCEETRRNIAALATGEDRKALQRETDYERDYCRR